MAASSTRGPKGQPRFPATDAPDLGVDEEIVADFAAAVGNRRVGTTAQRLALTGLDFYEGLAFGDTTLKAEFKVTNGVWKAIPNIQSEERTATTSAGGDVTVTFPEAFTTIASIFIQDTNAGAGIGPVLWKIRSKSNTQFVARAYGNGTGDPIGNFTTYFSYMAVGV